MLTVFRYNFDCVWMYFEFIQVYWDTFRIYLDTFLLCFATFEMDSDTFRMFYLDTVWPFLSAFENIANVFACNLTIFTW